MEPKRAVIVGVGGSGGWLAQALVKILEYKAPDSMLMLVDGDNYEQKNAERQVFTEMGNKAEVTATQLQEWHPGTFVIGKAAWVVPEGEGGKPTEEGETDEGVTKVTAKELLAENDIVFAMVDNFAARKLIFDAAREYQNIDVFTGGNDDALFCSIYHYARRDGKDVIDHPSEGHAEYVDPPDRNPGVLGCAERAALEGGTQLIATNMAVAAMLLGRTHYLFFDGEEGRVDDKAELMFDMGLGLWQTFDRRVEADESTMAPTGALMEAGVGTGS